jgi:Zn ribbon nucleic-acid-binding protein
VEKHDLIVKDHKFIAPLRCDECGGNAHLTRRSPHPVDGLETRVFECHECGHQTKQIVKP